jgi:hypothetical protein
MRWGPRLAPSTPSCASRPSSAWIVAETPGHASTRTSTPSPPWHALRALTPDESDTSRIGAHACAAGGTTGATAPGRMKIGRTVRALFGSARAVVGGGATRFCAAARALAVTVVARSVRARRALCFMGTSAARG